MIKVDDFLNDNDNLIHWLVVDSVRVPDIAQLAYILEPSPDLFYLFSNTHFKHLIDYSPVVFKYTGGELLTNELKYDHVLNASSVIFSYDKNLPEKEVKLHLHNLMVIIVKGHLTLFRFYSSLFWEKVADGLDVQDLNYILGPFEQLSWIGEGKVFKSLIRGEGGEKALFPAPFSFNSKSFIGES